MSPLVLRQVAKNGRFFFADIKNRILTHQCRHGYIQHRPDQGEPSHCTSTGGRVMDYASKGNEPVIVIKSYDVNANHIYTALVQVALNYIRIGDSFQI